MLHLPYFRSESGTDEEFKCDQVPSCIKHPFITIHDTEQLLSVLQFAKDSMNALYFEKHKFFYLTISLRNQNNSNINNNDIVLCGEIMHYLSKYIKTFHIGMIGYNDIKITATKSEWNQLFDEIMKSCLNYQLSGIDIKLKRFHHSQYGYFNQFYIDLFSLNTAYHNNQITECYTINFELVIENNLISYWMNNTSQWNLFKNKLVNTTNIGHFILRLELLSFNDAINRKISELLQCIAYNQYISILTLKLRISSNYNQETKEWFNNKENKELISKSIQSGILHCIQNKQISHNFIPTQFKREYIDGNKMEFLHKEFEFRLDAHNSDYFWKQHLISIDALFLDELFKRINNNHYISLYSLYLNECCWNRNAIKSLCDLIQNIKYHSLEKLTLNDPIDDSQKYLIKQNDFQLLIDHLISYNCNITHFSFGNVGNSDEFIKNVINLIIHCNSFMKYIGLTFNKQTLNEIQCNAIIDAFFEHLMKLYKYQKCLQQTLKTLGCFNEDIIPIIVEYCKLNGFVVDILRAKCEGDIYQYYKNKMIQFMDVKEERNNENLSDKFENYMSSVLGGTECSVYMMFNFHRL